MVIPGGQQQIGDPVAVQIFDQVQLGEEVARAGQQRRILDPRDEAERSARGRAGVVDQPGDAGVGQGDEAEAGRSRLQAQHRGRQR